MYCIFNGSQETMDREKNILFSHLAQRVNTEFKWLSEQKESVTK